MSNIFVFCAPVFILWMLKCVHGQSIESVCKESCEANLTLTSRDRSLFCNAECKLDQCQFGCEHYNVALETTCQQACSESVVEESNPCLPVHRTLSHPPHGGPDSCPVFVLFCNEADVTSLGDLLVADVTSLGNLLVADVTSLGELVGN
ncbi:uncharacterized protein LOC110455093 [Mizuhopecten yessoensis]|uniref:uncharacterized protein LOC110455093 n=1 Tax=Mizuhopecten yessoensis TaxID=6573 RepID=UPI000B458851|nr:uncharacterized protein LOC110455093 [Mizuhopecten yessoensis]